MNPSTVPYEFLVRFDRVGQLAGMHYVTRDVYADAAGKPIFDKVGDPQPVAAGSDVLAGILSALNTQALAQVQDLQAQLATATATIAQQQAQLAAQGVPAPTDSTDVLLAQLNALFATVPAAYQGSLAVPYAIVRVLLQAGQPALARAVVEAQPVPEELTAVKVQILAALA